MTKLKNDKFRSARGGRARMYAISCVTCGALVCRYQKDGPAGALRRMYIDRISESKVLTNGKNLNCPKGHHLGIRIVYEKEKRPAFRMFADAVVKRITKA